MEFSQDKGVVPAGITAGFIFAYFLFTTILFFVLNLLNKIPASWTYFHIMGVSFGATLVGAVIQRLLK